MESLLSTAELTEILESGDDVRVLDCTVLIQPSDDRPFDAVPARADYDQGHIPGSGFIDQVAELSDPHSPFGFTALDTQGLAEAFGRRGIDATTRVVLYDRAFNMWATRVWWLLRSIGCDTAAVLDGGWKAWTADDRPISTDPEPPVPARTMVPSPRPGTIVGMAEVEAATADGNVCLVNALSAANHNGSDDSYGRPGHIPSSRNVFAVELVDPSTHRYRPLEELRDLFDEAGVGGDRIITWCGGGIAATSDAFILHLLGHTDVAIYDGSLSEWVAAGKPLDVPD